MGRKHGLLTCEMSYTCQKFELSHISCTHHKKRKFINVIMVDTNNSSILDLIVRVKPLFLVDQLHVFSLKIVGVALSAVVKICLEDWKEYPMLLLQQNLCMTIRKETKLPFHNNGNDQVEQRKSGKAKLEKHHLSVLWLIPHNVLYKLQKSLCFYIFQRSQRCFRICKYFFPTLIYKPKLPKNLTLKQTIYCFEVQKTYEHFLVSSCFKGHL